MLNATHKLFESSTLLASLPAQKRSDLAAQARPLQYRRNDVIYAEGTRPESLYLIVRGRVKLVKIAANGAETILGVFRTGDSIGELSALDNLPATHSAVAMESTTLVQIGLPLFRGLLRVSPDLSLELATHVSRRLREFEDRISGLSTNRVDQRIALLLLRIAAEQGQDRPAEVIDLPYTRQEMAEMVGTTVESCIRALSTFEREGAIRKLTRTRLKIERLRLKSLAEIN